MDQEVLKLNRGIYDSLKTFYEQKYNKEDLMMADIEEIILKNGLQ